MRYEFRPLVAWSGPVTLDRPYCRFRAPWQSTLDLLGRETEFLGAGLVVLQVDAPEGQIRRDGMLRAGARMYSPGVRVAFDSVHGPLTYATDRFDDWRDNVRAIALGLEALRAVDRYGVSSRGEQYRGWAAITAGSSPAPAGPPMSVEEAARTLAGHTDGLDWRKLPGDRDAIGRAFRAAARATSPDSGGDPVAFARVVGARDWLYIDLSTRPGGGR